MPYAIGGSSRIHQNTTGRNAINSIENSGKWFAQGQLRLSSGEKIKDSSDNVAGLITSGVLQARNSVLKSALKAVGNTLNISSILQDSLEKINSLVRSIKGIACLVFEIAPEDPVKEKFAKAAFNIAREIQDVVDTSILSGNKVLSNSSPPEIVVGFPSAYSLLTLNIDMAGSNIVFDMVKGKFNLNSLKTEEFAGVQGLDFTDFAKVTISDLGPFSNISINSTLQSLSIALENINVFTSNLCSVANNLSSQEKLLKEQIIGYNAIISKLENNQPVIEQTGSIS